MQAVIPAAGQGTRLRPLTASIPKPLVEVAGKPILTHCFETVREMGIEDVVVVVGYQKEAIIDHYGDSYRNLSLSYAVQSKRRGVGDAVRTAAPDVDGEFVVLNGDNVYAGNLSAVLARHRASDAEITIPVSEVSPENAREGAVCRFDEDNRLVGLVEKPDDPPSTTVPAACYVLPPEAFLACELIKPSDRGEYELPDAVDLLLYSGYTVQTVPFEGWKININTEADLERATEKLRAETN